MSVQLMNALYQKRVKGIVLALHQALKAIVEQDEQAAQEVMYLKDDVRRYVSEAQAHLAISLAWAGGESEAIPL